MPDKETELVEMTIEDVVDRWPETALVFHRHNMACVGCPVAPFYTIADAASVYGLDAEVFVTELRDVMGDGAPPEGAD